MELKKEFTELEKSAVKLTVTVAKDDVKAAYDSILKKYMKSVQIPGFRKGHVPANVLERKFGDGLKSEAAGEVVDKALNEIFADNESQYRPLPYAQPEMEKMPDFDMEKDMSFTVTYDVFPKVSVIDLKGIEVKEPQVKIGEKELNDELKSIQERNAMVMDKKDGEPVEKDNIVTVNYCELDDSDKEIENTKRQDYVFTVGSGMNIYKIDDDVLGMKKGETKSITKTYAENEADKDLAGKTKKLSVTVTQIKTRTLPDLDDELAQDVNEKYKTLDDMKNDIKKNLEHACNRRVNELKNNDLLSKIVEKNQFDIPESMMKAELQGRWEMMAQQFQTSGAQLDKMFSSTGQSKDDIMNEWRPESEKMLKSRIIVDNLIKERNISVTPEEVEAQYQRIADDAGITVDEVKKHYEDPRSKEYLVDDTKEQKLYDELYKEVKVVKGDKMTFAELFERR